MRSIALLVKRIAIVAVALVCILYAGEFISVKYGIPASRKPFDVVQINKYYAVPQKGGKTEFEPGEPETQTCVNSVFPHLGYSPCWYVNRHRNQQINF
jgi:hypothetical protein